MTTRMFPSRKNKTASVVRIAVSGTHGVGKTTFCFDLSVALSIRGARTKIITDVARTLHSEGVPINRETTESQYALFFQRHAENLLIDDGSNYFIYDRTLLDSLAYARANGNLGEGWRSFAETSFHFMDHHIDIYFFVPIEFKIENDGTRDLDRAYQSRVDREVTFLLKKLRPNYVIVTGTRSQRTARALEVIEHLSPQ